MKIMICGSMSLAREMLEAQRQLQEMGHETIVPCDTQMFVDNPVMTTDNHEENLKHCLDNDIVRRSFKDIENSDALLILNHPKHNLEGYIGPSALMEMGIAYHFGKNIFLLYPPPILEKARSTHEVVIMDPIVLNGDLKNIEEFLKPKIILATSSPYRQEVFKNLDLKFTAEGSNINERFESRPETPEELVTELSKRKAEAVAQNHSDGIVIGFDSMGWFNDQILEKPQSREEAFQRLKTLSGNTYYFFTGIYMKNISTDQVLSRIAKTEISMRNLSDSEINKYLDQDPNYSTYAHGYDPVGNYSSTFVKSINGSCLNHLQGIPLETIMEMLFEIGYSI